MASDFSIAELDDAQLPTVIELCRTALDLPDDAAEADAIVPRLRHAASTGNGAPPQRPVRDGVTARRAVGLVAFVQGTLAGVVLGSTGYRDPAVGHADLLAVHPAHRRRGIGRALLRRAEAVLGGLGAAEVLLAGNPPHYAWPGIDVRYTPAVCLAQALGYQRDRTAWNMTVDLSSGDSPALRGTEAAEERLAEAGVAVRRAEPEDVAELVEFARTNFGGSWDVEIADSVGRAGAGCHIAVRAAAGQVLGFAAYGSSRPSWFGPMGTAEAARGLGIGAVLLRRCLADQRAEGRRRAEIGWVGPVPFYANAVGARIERVFFLYRKPL